MIISFDGKTIDETVREVLLDKAQFTPDDYITALREIQKRYEAVADRDNLFANSSLTTLRKFPMNEQIDHHLSKYKNIVSNRDIKLQDGMDYAVGLRNLDQLRGVKAQAEQLVRNFEHLGVIYDHDSKALDIFQSPDNKLFAIGGIYKGLSIGSLRK